MEWQSVRTNVAAAEETFTDQNELDGVMGRNAIEILGLNLKVMDSFNSK
jgi:hypothetical protein